MKSEIVKPKAKVSGKDGNVFVLLSICQRALIIAKQGDREKEMCKRVFSSKNYNEAVSIMAEYCKLC